MIPIFSIVLTQLLLATPASSLLVTITKILSSGGFFKYSAKAFLPSSGNLLLRSFNSKICLLLNKDKLADACVRFCQSKLFSTDMVLKALKQAFFAAVIIASRLSFTNKISSPVIKYAGFKFCVNFCASCSG